MRLSNAERSKAWREAHPERARHSLRTWKLRNKYNLSPEEYEAMVVVQGGGCAICGSPPPDGVSLCVDHDHASGRVRQLLCASCNRFIGLAGDDPARLRRAADYLESHAEQADRATQGA